MRKEQIMIIIFGLMCIFSPFTLCAQSPVDWLLKKTEGLKSTKLSETKIADGLKEALRVGIDNAVKLTGKQNGFFGNTAIKILMPEKVKILEKGLRTIGMGPKIDEFILSMNRAAENAAPYARDIFIDAIMDMSFDDVMAIYKGNDTAATEYFKKKTQNKLIETFLPHAQQSLNQYAVTKRYRELVNKYKALPLANKLPVFDVENYVVTKTVDGLFCVLSQEEKKIRTQPSARVTKLLQEVFK